MKISHKNYLIRRISIIILLAILAFVIYFISEKNNLSQYKGTNPFTTTAVANNIQTITLNDGNGLNAIYYDSTNNIVYGHYNESDPRQNVKIDSIPVPTRDNYIFKGFFSNSNQIIDENGLIDKVMLSNIHNAHSGDYSITAKWHTVKTITLDNDNGSGKITTIYYDTEDNNAYYYDSEDTQKNLQITSIPIPTKKGAIFNGYKKDSTTIINKDGKLDLNQIRFASLGSSYTVKAQWIPIQTITLDNDGGSGEINEIYYDSDNIDVYYYDKNTGKNVQITSVNVPTKSGYKFKGYKSQYGDLIINEQGNINMAAIRGTYQGTQSDYTATAQWEQFQTITLNDADGHGGIGAIYYVEKTDTVYGHYNESDPRQNVPITSVNVPTKSGYKFKGYKSQYGALIIDEQGNINMTAIRGTYQGTQSDYTATAQWTAVNNNNDGNGGNTGNNNGGSAGNTENGGNTGNNNSGSAGNTENGGNTGNNNGENTGNGGNTGNNNGGSAGSTTNSKTPSTKSSSTTAGNASSQTTSSNILPKTGSAYFILILIISTIIFGIYSLKKYKNLNLK